MKMGSLLEKVFYNLFLIRINIKDLPILRGQGRVEASSVNYSEDFSVI